MIIKDRLLFLKYALPCAGTLVKRGKVSAEEVDNAVRLVSEGKLPAPGFEDIFRVATAMCERLAKDSGKDCIDVDTIRRYFIAGHSKVVDDRFKLMRDFDPVSCKTYLGKVITADGGFAIVDTERGKKMYRAEFAKSLREGDEVIVHWDFVVEKAPRGLWAGPSGRNDEGRE